MWKMSISHHKMWKCVLTVSEMWNRCISWHDLSFVLQHQCVSMIFLWYSFSPVNPKMQQWNVYHCVYIIHHSLVKFNTQANQNIKCLRNLGLFIHLTQAVFGGQCSLDRRQKMLIKLHWHIASVGSCDRITYTVF